MTFDFDRQAVDSAMRLAEASPDGHPNLVILAGEVKRLRVLFYDPQIRPLEERITLLEQENQNLRIQIKNQAPFDWVATEMPLDKAMEISENHDEWFQKPPTAMPSVNWTLRHEIRRLRKENGKYAGIIDAIIGDFPGLTVYLGPLIGKLQFRMRRKRRK